MVDEIKFPKTVPTVSSASRIHKVKRRQSNTNQDRFERQLHDEKQEEEIEDEQGSDQEKRNEKQKTSAGGPPPEHEEQDEDAEKNQGKLVDVVI